MHNMMAGSKCKGVLLVVLGILFLLGTLGVWPEFTFGTYWPLFLILFGLHGVFCNCGSKMMGGKGMCGCGKEGGCAC